MVTNRTTAPPLVVRFGALGDMIMLTPALQAIFDRYDQAVDVVTSGGWSRHLYDGLEFVGKVHVLHSRKTPYFLDTSQRRLVHELQDRGAGPCWLLETLPKTHWLIDRGGIPDSLIVHPVRYPLLPDEHDLEHMLRLARIDPPAAAPVRDDPGRDYVPRLTFSEDELAECLAWCESVGIVAGNTVVVQPGNKRTMLGGWRRRPSNVKYWPEERWARVIEMVLERGDHYRVVINAVPSELPLAEDIFRKLEPAGRKRTIVGQTPLRRLIVLLSLADSCISVDTGPAHIAGAVGCPVVVLFGSTSPRSYRPWGDPGTVLVVSRNPHERDGSIDSEGRLWSPGSTMDAIDVELVLDAWDRLPPRRRT